MGIRAHPIHLWLQSEMQFLSLWWLQQFNRFLMLWFVCCEYEFKFLILIIGSWTECNLFCGGKRWRA